MRIAVFISVLLLALHAASAQQQDDCLALERMAMEKYDSKQYNEALVYMEKCLASCGTSIPAYYNTACIASLAGNKAKGLTYLKEAVRIGYSDTMQMNRDQDLAYLRSLNEWSQVNRWIEETRSQLRKEVAKIHSGCPASGVIPYTTGGRWGYLDKRTKHKITAPVFTQLSFVGQTGSAVFGSTELLFSCSGKVIQEDVYYGSDQAAYSRHVEPSKIITKGFTIEKGEIATYASVYDDFTAVGFNYGELYAIVSLNNRYSLIDSSCREMHGITGYTKLEFYNYGMDSEYFPDEDKYSDFFIFYTDTLGEAGFFDSRFNPLPLPRVTAFEKPRGNGFEREYLDKVRQYVYLKQAGKWGIWDCNTLKWTVQPEYDEILYTDRTFDGKQEELYYSGNTIDLYFLVQQNGQRFFIDLENTKYRPAK